MAGTITSRSPISHAEIRAVVWPRCAACRHPNGKHLDRCEQCGTLTPKPRDLGAVAYYHRNPLRRIAWRVGRIWRALRQL